MTKLVKAIHHVPLRIIGIIVALHSVIYGVGYLIPTGGFFQTVLFASVTEIMSADVFGTILLIVGLGLIYGFTASKGWVVEWLSNVQSVIWLFATFVYFFNGFWLLGLGIGLIWSLLSAYVAFAFRNRDKTINELVRRRLAQS